MTFLRATMSLNRGVNGKAPCPICIVPDVEQKFLYIEPKHAIRQWQEHQEIMQKDISKTAKKEELKHLGLRLAEVHHLINSCDVSIDPLALECVLEDAALRCTPCPVLGPPPCISWWSLQ